MNLWGLVLSVHKLKLEIFDCLTPKKDPVYLLESIDFSINVFVHVRKVSNKIKQLICIIHGVIIFCKSSTDACILFCSLHAFEPIVCTQIKLNEINQTNKPLKHSIHLLEPKHFRICVCVRMHLKPSPNSDQPIH